MQSEISVDQATRLSEHAESVVRVATHPQTGQNALHARRAFQAGDVISRFSSASVNSTPSYLTVQVGEDMHIELFPRILQYMNHFCDPNSFFDTTRMEVVALRDIAEGEELGFFYPSSEWHMVQPFECLCGSSQCLHVIAGADSINEELLSRYRLTDFIQSKLNQRNSRNV